MRNFHARKEGMSSLFKIKSLANAFRNGIMKSSKKFGIILGLTMSLVFAGCATQTAMISTGMGNVLSSPKFEFFIVNYPSLTPDSSAGDFFARVRFDEVIFTKTDSGFTARYQLSLSMYPNSTSTETSLSRSFDRHISVANYDQTISTTKYDTLKCKFVMKPGKYLVEIRLLDLNTNATSSSEFTYTFKDFLRDSVSISNLVLRDSSDTSGYPVEVVRNNVQDLFADFYVTTSELPSDILFHVIAKSTEAPTSIDTTFRRDQSAMVQRCNWPISIRGLAPAPYDLRISVKCKGKEDFAETGFRITGDSTAMIGVNNEIGPLAYVMKRNAFDSLGSETDEHRQKTLNEFWLERASGDTAVAGAMKGEFYKRVGAADEQFGTAMVAGWATDRGKIYILYGKPDRIENRSNNFNRRNAFGRAGQASTEPPYQIWYYDSLKLRFVFVDELRNGDYRLARTDGT